MADRPHRGGRGGGNFRGGRGGGGGGRGGGGAGSGAANAQQQQQQERERPKKENILDLKKYMDKRITVKFNGGREGSFFFLTSFPFALNFPLLLLPFPLLFLLLDDEMGD